MIGQAERRLEDPRLITGRGRYVDDIPANGALHAVFVRSVEAHALIRSVTVDPSYEGPATVYVATDLGLTEPMPNQFPSPAITQSIQAPPLATDEVCYVGQPIAVVLAPSVTGAIDGSESVVVDYEPLPVVIDHRHALDEDAAVAHKGTSSNLIATLTDSSGDVDAVMSKAPGSITIAIDQHRGALASMEGRAVLASWDDATDSLTLWSSSQAPHAVRDHVAAYLGMSPDDLRVVTPDVGGGFGPKAAVYPEEYVLAALSRRLRSRVRWVERRREHFTASIQQRGQSGRVEVAFDDRGRILALKARLIHDFGAFVPYGIVVPFTTKRLMSGPYAIDAIDVAIQCVFTNATPTAAIRGAGRPNAVFAVERAMDAVARELGLDRAEIRRRNFIGPEAFPYEPGMKLADGSPVVYDSGRYADGLDQAIAAASIGDFAERRAEAQSRGRLRGYGIASYVEDTGFGPYDGARIEILPNGDVVVETGSSSQGQGHETVFAQICGHHLGVEMGRVKVRSGDTGRYPHGIATIASRTGQTTASVVHDAAGDLARTVKEVAAASLEASTEDIVLTDGVAMVVGQPGTEIPLGELASSLQPKPGGWLPEGQRTPGLSAERVTPFGGSAFTFGTHVAEVEIDPETGHIEVVAYVVAHDCGTLLNPMIVDGQIDGGVAHGLGNALTEQVRYSEAGQPLTTTFMDYRLMSSVDMPDLVKVHSETPSPTNPLGAKGAGEGGTIPVAAAIVSAVEDALSEHGVTINHYPVLPEWVHHAIREASAPSR